MSVCEVDSPEAPHLLIHAAYRHLPFAIRNSRFAIRNPQSATTIRSSHSAILHSQFATRCSLSAVRKDAPAAHFNSSPFALSSNCYIFPGFCTRPLASTCNVNQQARTKTRGYIGTVKHHQSIFIPITSYFISKHPLSTLCRFSRHFQRIPVQALQSL